MKFAGLAPIVATLAVVFASSAVALDNGQVIEICQEGPTPELWQEVTVSGNNQDGVRIIHSSKLNGGCNVLGGFFWVGRVLLSFSQQLGNPDLDSPITNVQPCEVPREFQGATFRCALESKPTEN